YRAAEFYYSKLLKDYSDTPLADNAKQSIASNEGKPPVPPQRLEWLVNLFPQRENAKPLIPNDNPAETTASRRK
ncbi:MAG TPA: hypothetical protein PLV92_22825, partial [Pirellulaceae bacterium]|nr:hypothetical protein [Pirellulaceae bacterium]